MGAVPDLKCMRCKSHLRLHPSLETISPSAFDLLTGKIEAAKVRSVPYSTNDHQTTQNESVGKITHKREQHASQGFDSFIVLSDSSGHADTVNHRSTGRDASELVSDRSANAISEQQRAEASISQNLHISAQLFDILSAKTSINHPICSECADLLTIEMNAQLNEAKKQRTSYLQFLKNLHVDFLDDDEIRESNLELELLNRQQDEALSELTTLEAKKRDIDGEIVKIHEGSAALLLEEETFWRHINQVAFDLDEAQREYDEVQQKYLSDSKQLERLQRTNVYNDAFCITHDGWFGVINGLRLGRLPDKVVEWSEINAAWGQVLLLLATISELLGFKFENYILHPRGSMSTIERMEQNSGGVRKSTYLDLYSSGDFTLGRLFMHRKFDAGMMALLDCLRQLGEYCESCDEQLNLPYKICKDNIGDACIRIAFNQDEHWTRACKFVLTNCKWILAFTSKTASQNKLQAASPSMSSTT